MLKAEVLIAKMAAKEVMYKTLTEKRMFANTHYPCAF
jgi:hypothetical protein